MNQAQITKLVDEIATRDPEAFGYGYADTQFAWQHAPAIDHVRPAFHEFLTMVAEQAPRGSVLQVGTGNRIGTRLALASSGRRLVTVASDGEHQAGATLDADAAMDRDLVIGDPANPVVIAAVLARIPNCALLLLDHGDDYVTTCAAWQAYAPLVVEGGIVAIVDRSQTMAGKLAGHNVDQWVTDLERQFLMPYGVRLRRFGQASSIHCYVQSASTRQDTTAPTPPPSMVVPPLPQAIGNEAGFVFYQWREQVLAIPENEGPLRLQALFRNDYSLALSAPTHDAARSLVAAWCDAEPRLQDARRQLAQGQPNAAAELVHAVIQAYPELSEQLAESLELLPWNRRLLMALGTLDTFGPQPREGVALLRRALDMEVLDPELLQILATAHLALLQDDSGARAVLATAKHQVRKRHVTKVSRTLPRGHLLWQYPQLLADVRGVVQVGAHRGEDVASWCQLEVPTQIYVEANPNAVADLQRVCAAESYGDKRVLAAAVGASVGTAELRYGERTERASMLPHHPLARVPAGEQQQGNLSVSMTTLDELVDRGEIDPSACNLLFVDVEGSELEVLRGATELLRYVDLISVGVFLEPVYVGAPMPQEIQTFLRELYDDHGFALRAFEVGDDPSRGQGIFRRFRSR